MGKCRDCALYDLKAVLSANGRVLSNRTARCLWKSEETWPVSASEHLNRRPMASSMEPNDGEGCLVFKPR